MPSNGLVYSAPHNCACYPEAKLFGLNALAPASPRKLPADVPPEDRLTKGPAYGKTRNANLRAEKDAWPTYRGSSAREAFTGSNIDPHLEQAWETELEGRLSAITAANGKLYVAQVDAHTLHALNASTGKSAWTYTAGGRIDSPPTLHEGAVLFGSCDGYIYCLRASDGKLAWKFRAAPSDLRTMAFEQLESLWPVHGSILVEDGLGYAIAGRSNFLDSGLRFYKFEPHTGKVLTTKVIDSKDPTDGSELQDGLRTLQMSVGLSDILSSDGESVYMRSSTLRLRRESYRYRTSFWRCTNPRLSTIRRWSSPFHPLASLMVTGSIEVTGCLAKLCRWSQRVLSGRKIYAIRTNSRMRW